MKTKKGRQPRPKTMFIHAKVGDGFYCAFGNKEDKVVSRYDGYVPDFMPGEHWGDYIRLHIDLKTGRILNWDVTGEKIDAFLNDPENANRFTYPEDETE